MKQKPGKTTAEALRIAREKYPERYETIVFGPLQEQRVDINALNRAAYVAFLTKAADPGA